MASDSSDRSVFADSRIFELANSVAIRSRQSEIASSSTENISSNSVVWAWGELRADEPEAQPLRDAGDFEYDNSLAMLDPFMERDVPEWLVMATTDILDGDNDQKDGCMSSRH